MAVDRFFADHCAQHAAAIAYRVLFSIVPLAIVLASIFGLVLQDDGVRHDVTKTIADALPVSAAGRQDVEDALTAIATPASAAGLASLVVFAWAATGMMSAIRQGLESAMGVTTRGRWRAGSSSTSCWSSAPPRSCWSRPGSPSLGQLVHTAGGGVASATDIGAGNALGRPRPR